MVATLNETSGDVSISKNKNEASLLPPSSLSSSRPLKVHGMFGHPDQRWLELILVSIFSYFFPLYKVVEYPPTKSSQESLEFVDQLGITLAKFEEPLKVKGYPALAKAAGCEGKLCEFIYHIPAATHRHDDDDDNDDQASLFHKWNILPKTNPPSLFGNSTDNIDNNLITPETTTVANDNNSSSIPVFCYFSASLLPDTIEQPTETNVYGCLIEKKENSNNNNNNNNNESLDELFSTISDDIPIIVHFCGGGLIMSDPRKPDFVDLLTKVFIDHPLPPSDNKPEDGDSSQEQMTSTKERPFVVASVAYSVAPRHTFPGSLLEALTVVSSFLDRKLSPNRKVHIVGISAGGYLATVATLECLRRYPGRIASSSIFCPMVDPMACSHSYYENVKCSPLATVGFLRWGWQAFLGLPAPKEEEEEEDDIPNMDDDGSELQQQERHSLSLLRRGSNYTAFKESRYGKDPHLERFVCPLVNLATNAPPGLLDKTTAPKFLVLTNRVDPLHDEGVQLVNALRSSSTSSSSSPSTGGDSDVQNVVHVDCKGGHWTGLNYDQDSHKQLLDSVYDMIFDGSSQVLGPKIG